MYPKRLMNYIVMEQEDIYKAHWKLHRGGGILIVLDENETYQGVITFRDMAKTYDTPSLTISDICNRNGKYLIDREDLYLYARNLFVEYPYVRHIPVLNENRDLVDILTRERVFWKHMYREARLPRMHYAYCIWNAAMEAKSLGYSSFSVIEFGVAGGNGLLNCELHAKEISKILEIDIEIYGFDSSEGLPVQNMGYKDMVHIWPAGSYHMNRTALEERLEKAVLVIGKIEETTKTFFETYHPAPIGCMLVDVDYYSSTLPIMEFLEESDQHFAPRIHMYFDDLSSEYEFSGEALAIREFNRRNEMIKISPEGLSYPDYREHIKICHRFSHEKYNEPSAIFLNCELTPEHFELKLMNTL